MKGEYLKVNHERYPQRAGGKTKSYEVAVDCRFVEVAGNYYMYESILIN